MSDLHADGPPTGRFATTCWSLVVAAGGPPGDVLREALGALFAAYWAPLYGFIRGRGYSAHEAEDLAQGFFAPLLEKGVLGRSTAGRGGSGRSSWPRARTSSRIGTITTPPRKRGGGRRFVPLDAESRIGPLPASGPRPRPCSIAAGRWPCSTASSAGSIPRCAAPGRRPCSARLSPALLGDIQAPSYAEIASDLGMTEGAVKVAAHRLRGRYRDLLREEIARTVADPSEIDDEIRDLFRRLRGG